MTPEGDRPEPVDVEAILAAVGPALRVQYNKPHVYPMAAPMFILRPGAERDKPPRGPIEVYVHVPFCNYKCGFCTYATRQGAQSEQMQRYVRALKRELEWLESGWPLTQLYVGGGTPTVLPPALLSDVLGAVWQWLSPLPGTVHTVECSPESLTPCHVEVFRQHRIERVSMGVQSLDERVLQALHRRHSRQDALAACDLLVRAGLMTSIDLIYGLPGQTEASFQHDFRTLGDRGVHSVTVYNLRLNEKTPVAAVLEEDESLELGRLVKWRALVAATAAEQGFVQTRWHTFVRRELPDGPAHPAARFEDSTAIGNQFAAGMSARSRLGGTVYRNHTDFNQYLERIETGRSPVQETFTLGEEDRKTLYIGQSLGSGKPLDRAGYRGAFGHSVEDDFGPVLARLRESGFIEVTDQFISLTRTGRLVFDLVTWMFYPRQAREWIAKRQDVEFRPRKKPFPLPVRNPEAN